MAITTPLLEQYWAIKAKHKDSILLFRMGDFYELLYEDARTASRVLGLTLTSRSYGKAGNVPLAGFPHHSLESYLSKLIRAGYKVAICEQVEDPKKAKKLVKRDVIEIVTPGTALSDNLLEAKRNNFLVAVYLKGKACGLSWVDLSTGEFVASEFDKEEMVDQILTLSPSELLVSEEQHSFISSQLNTPAPFPITRREEWTFSRDYAYETLTEHFKTLTLKGFGCEDMDPGICAAGAILNYLKENQKSDLPHINRLSRLHQSDYMILDPATMRNLEILTPIMGDGREGTLISILDRTVTAMGGRMLRNWIQRPLRNPSLINQRLSAVEEFFSDEELRAKVIRELRKIGDLERLISKVSTNRASARDLIALKKSLKVVPTIKGLLSKVESEKLREIQRGLSDLKEVVQRIEEAIVDDPPLVITEGGIIKKGYNKELDELREIAFSGREWIANLQRTEQERTGISSLKVGYNKVFGYYIEVTKPHLSKVPEDYIRKQTLVGAERFITPELKEYEEKVLGAEEKIASLEYELFDQIRRFIAERAAAVQRNAGLLAQLDCLSALAEVAVENDYHRPQISEDDQIIIKDGRHPVVEKLLPPGEPFIPNDTVLDNQKNQILIITGPNMAGKSTYIRQVGLITLMAQMGSFVPAKEARIGLVDRIFTRVGAQDNLAGGESTFLVEMNETANILNNATPKSLILLDEIGRGTSTFDGLSIAWAVAEYIHNNPRVSAKTLFATHYHELTELALVLPRVKNYNVAVKEWGDNIVFLRKIVEGGCDHSYGIQVARLAGLPDEVIERAKGVLSNLEAEELTPNRVPKLAIRRRVNGKARSSQLDLFSRQERYLREEIKKLDIDRMTPLEALNKLNELKRAVEER